MLDGEDAVDQLVTVPVAAIRRWLGGGNAAADDVGAVRAGRFGVMGGP
jgi:hypothetical protein